MTLEKNLPREDGTPAKVKFENLSAPEILFSILVACGTPVSGPLDGVTEDPVITGPSVVACAELCAVLAAADAV